MKNYYIARNTVGTSKPLQEKVLYVTVPGDDADQDFKVEQSGDSFTVTEVKSRETQVINLTDYNFEHNCLIELCQENKNTKLQLMKQENDLHFQFYFGGNKINTQVFDEQQYKYKHFMKKPVKLDTTKMVMSPMPGSIVSVSVQPGQTVVDGQILCVIEAMKMQNLIKSQCEGKIKTVKVVAGDSVAVDQLLIEFE